LIQSIKIINFLTSDESPIWKNVTESEKKAAIVERFNKTLKERMWRMFTFNKNKKYVGYLDDLLISYNNSIHRSIKNKPSKINKKMNKKLLIFYIAIIIK
jgi:hypothetical protein